MLFASVSQDILPCVPFNVAKSVKSLYLGRMFSGTPVIRLRFKRLQPTRWEVAGGAPRSWHSHGGRVPCPSLWVGVDARHCGACFQRWGESWGACLPAPHVGLGLAGWQIVSHRPVCHLLFLTLPLRLLAEFDFRTFDPEGVLFFAGGRQDSTWIVLGLRAGRLELQLRYRGVGRVTSSGPVINHGMWQTVSVATTAAWRMGLLGKVCFGTRQ